MIKVDISEEAKLNNDMNYIMNKLFNHAACHYFTLFILILYVYDLYVHVNDFAYEIKIRVLGRRLLCGL